MWFISAYQVGAQVMLIKVIYARLVSLFLLSLNALYLTECFEKTRERQCRNSPRVHDSAQCSGGGHQGQYYRKPQT